MFVKPLAERFHVLGLSMPRALLLLGSVLSLRLPEAIIRSLVRLNAMFTRSMQFMIGWRLRPSIKLVCELVILADELVYLSFYHTVLIVQHLNMVLKSLLLCQ